MQSSKSATQQTTNFDAHFSGLGSVNFIILTSVEERKPKARPNLMILEISDPTTPDWMLVWEPLAALITSEG